MAKAFRLRPDQLRPLVPDMGRCIASDRITVEGARVGFMYRDPPEDDADSGWRFLAGDEPEDDDASRYELYAVNTIANHDPEIIPLLGAPPRSAFARDPDTGAFVEEPYEGEG